MKLTWKKLKSYGEEEATLKDGTVLRLIFCMTSGQMTSECSWALRITPPGKPEENYGHFNEKHDVKNMVATLCGFDAETPLKPAKEWYCFSCHKAKTESEFSQHFAEENSGKGFERSPRCDTCREKGKTK